MGEDGKARLEASLVTEQWPRKAMATQGGHDLGEKCFLLNLQLALPVSVLPD